jgi:hypothetical protein
METSGDLYEAESTVLKGPPPRQSGRLNRGRVPYPKAFRSTSNGGKFSTVIHPARACQAARGQLVHNICG